MGMAFIGLSSADIKAVTSTAFHRPGTIGGWDDPIAGYKEYVYGKANGTVTGAGYLCVETTGFRFQLATTTNTANGTAGHGSRVGAAQNALVDGEYGWFQIYGKGPIRTLASAAIGFRLNTTATGGAVDDDGTTGARAILGLVLGTATGGAAATNVDGMYNYPSVGLTI